MLNALGIAQGIYLLVGGHHTRTRGERLEAGHGRFPPAAGGNGCRWSPRERVPKQTRHHLAGSAALSASQFLGRGQQIVVDVQGGTHVALRQLDELMN